MLKADEVNREIKRIEENFKIWLSMSGFSFKQFLEYRYMSNFQIIRKQDDEYNIVMIGCINNGCFTQIGEQFVYRQDDNSAFQDLALMLLYMAEKLDSANREEMALRPRGYFYNKTKDFIKSIYI